MTFKFTADQEAWLRDLETTDAEQGTGALNLNGYRYCCLGRACVAIGERPTSLDSLGQFWYGNSAAVLPVEIWKRLKLRGKTGDFERALVIHGHKYTALTQLNDEAQWSFKQIAAFIRANPEAVFTGGAE